jgi:hypothetical protein
MIDAAQRIPAEAECHAIAVKTRHSQANIHNLDSLPMECALQRMPL